jgi:ring-1,2-phenylacetyl-CoA epoxidase subunit PaaE
MAHAFHSLRIVARREETADAVSLALEVPDALRSQFAYLPGQHVVVRAFLDGQEARRTYSISSAPGDRDLWITVKRQPGGAFSAHAHATLIPGARLDAMRPTGRFVSPPADERPSRCLALCAGSGITPVIAIVEHALARDPASQVTLIYGNRTVDAIIFRDRLEDLKDRHLTRLQVFHVLSREQDADVPLLAGRVDGEKVRTFMTTVLRPAAVDHVFLCGPGSMIQDARETLTDIGVPQARIHFEYFTEGPSMARWRTTPGAAAVEPESVPVGAEVIAIVDGTRKTFHVAPGHRVIDAAIAAGVSLPYSCKGGMCTTCRARLVEGKVHMDRNFSLEPWELEAGFVLTCQAQPQSERVVVDYDQM